MALFGVLARGAATLARGAFKGGRAATGAILSRPGVRAAIKGTGIGATALAVGQALIPQGAKGGLPALPGMPGAGGFPGMAGPGERSIFRDDPNVVEALKPWAISVRGLRTYYRAPKGYVVMHDQIGDAYGIPKALAKTYLGWKPAKKPLLSIRDTSALKRAGVAIKKLQNAEKMAKKIANWKTPTRRMDRPTVIQLPGPTKVGRKVA